MCLKVSLLLYSSRSDRKIRDLVLMINNTLLVTVLAWMNFLLRWRSPAAQIVHSFQRGELVQVQDVDAMVSCWILQLYFVEGDNSAC